MTLVKQATFGRTGKVNSDDGHIRLTAFGPCTLPGWRVNYRHVMMCQRSLAVSRQSETDAATDADCADVSEIS